MQLGTATSLDSKRLFLSKKRACVTTLTCLSLIPCVLFAVDLLSNSRAHATLDPSACGTTQRCVSLEYNVLCVLCARERHASAHTCANTSSPPHLAIHTDAF